MGSMISVLEWTRTWEGRRFSVPFFIFLHVLPCDLLVGWQFHEFDEKLFLLC